MKFQDCQRMKNKEIKTVVPKLRFPEFRGANKWSCLKGGKVFDQVSNKIHHSDIPILAITQEYGAIPRDQIDYSVIVSDKSIENYKVVEIGDFIISLRSFQGGIEYSYYKGLCSPAYVILRKKININNYFFKYYFKTTSLIRDLNKNLEGIRDGKMITYKQFSEISLPVPIFNEQQKIADCLSSIDNLITFTVKKMEALKAHKKGLMQQLFPAEGKKVPAIRFSEFQDAGEWKEKTIQAIGEVVTGNTPSKNEKEFWGGNFVWITAQDFKDKYIYDSALKLTEKGRKKSKIIPQNSVLVTCIASIGLNGINKIKCATNQQINSVVCDPGYEYEFVYYAISYNNDRLKSLAGQTAVPIISKSVFENFVILIPKQKEEQQKIADCLSSLDELITALAQKLEALKTHKKGLMQQLFPDMNE